MQDRIKSLIVSSLAHFQNDGVNNIFIILYPKLFPSGALYIGILAGLQNVISMAVSPLVGRRGDRTKDYGGLMALGLALSGIGVIGYSVSTILFGGFNLFLILIPFAVTAGVGAAFYHPVGAVAIQESWGEAVSGRALGINGAMGSLGRTIYPLITVIIVVAFAVQSAAVFGVLSFLVAFLVFVTFRNLRSIIRQRTNSDNVSNTNPQKKEVRLREILPIVFPLTAVAFFRGIFSGIISFIPYYLTHVSHFGYNLELGVAFTIMLAGGIIGQPFCGFIADHFGRRLGLGIINASAVISMLLFLSNSNPSLAEVYLFAFGFFVFTAYPAFLPLTKMIAPEGAATMASSIVWGIGNSGGGAVGPILIGILAESAFLGSLTNSFYAVTIAGALSVALIPLIQRPQHK